MYTDEEIRSLPAHEQLAAHKMMGNASEVKEIEDSWLKGTNNPSDPTVAIIVCLVAFSIWFLMRFYYFAKVAVTSEPITFFTNPFWIVAIIFFAFHYFAPKLISALLITISLPSLVGGVYFVILYALAILSGNSYLTPGLLDTINPIYTYAYGKELGDAINYFTMSTELTRYVELKNMGIFVFCLQLVNTVILAASSIFLYRLYYEIISKVKGAALSAGFNEGDYMWDYAYTIIVMMVTYSFCIPYIEATTELPYGINFVVAWSIFLFPFLGIRIAKSNYTIIGKYKMARYFTYYYILFFPALIYCMADLKGINLSKILSSGYVDESVILMLVPLFSFYILIKSLLKNRKAKDK